MTESVGELAVGIDLGGTSVRVGLFDGGMRRLSSRSFRTRVAAGPDAVVAEMAECVEGLLGESGEGVLRGIGIGSPGPLNLVEGTLGSLPNFPGWDGYPLRESLARATGCRVFLECDANAAALAEWKLGAGHTAGIDSLAMITLGTGVGSGLILNGRVWHGMVGMGGEVGHASIDRNGPPCPCGGRGCLEVYASARGLQRLAVDEARVASGTSGLRALVERAEGFTAQEVAELAKAGDGAACEVFVRFGSDLGFGIAGLISTLDLPMVILGGGVASAWELFAPSMFETVRRFSMVYRLGEPGQRERIERNRTFILPAQLGTAAGLLGAALLPSLMGAEAVLPDGPAARGAVTS